MDHDQRPRQRAGRRREGVQAQNLVQQQDDGHVDRTLRDVIPQQQLFRVVFYLLEILCADAAADDGDHRQTHRVAHDAADGVEVIRDRIGRDMYRAEQRDHRDNQHTSQLEQAVLKRRGDANVQDIFGGAALQMGDGAQRDVQDILRLGGQRQNDGRAHRTGDQRGHSDARDAHLQHKDAERVAEKVDGVDNDRDFHRHSAVAGGAEDGRARVVQRQKREGQRRDREVDKAGFHDVIGDRAEEKPQLRRAGQQAERRDADAQQRAETDELPGAFGGIPLPLGAKVLAGDDRAAGRQCAEQRDNKLVDHIHQRNTGDRGLAHRRDHDGIRHADEDFQRLLDDKRPEQRQQLAVGKQPFLFHMCQHLTSPV